MSLVKIQRRFFHATHAMESAMPNMWSGLVATWPMCLGNRGYRVYNIVRRGNTTHDGRLTNMPVDTVWVADPIGVGLRFGGAANHHVRTAGDVDEYDFAGASAGPITIVVWLRCTTSANGTVVMKGGWNTSNPGWRVGLSSSTGQTLFFATYTSSAGNFAYWANDPIVDDQVHHLALIVPSSGIPMLYLDGRQRTHSSSNSDVGTSAIGPSTRPVGIGGRPDLNDLPLNGVIYDVRIYRRALSSQEIVYDFTYPFLLYRRSVVCVPWVVSPGMIMTLAASSSTTPQVTLNAGQTLSLQTALSTLLPTALGVPHTSALSTSPQVAVGSACSIVVVPPPFTSGVGSSVQVGQLLNLLWSSVLSAGSAATAAVGVNVASLIAASVASIVSSYEVLAILMSAAVAAQTGLSMSSHVDSHTLLSSDVSETEVSNLKVDAQVSFPLTGSISPLLDMLRLFAIHLQLHSPTLMTAQTSVDHTSVYHLIIALTASTASMCIYSALSVLAASLTHAAKTSLDVQTFSALSASAILPTHTAIESQLASALAVVSGLSQDERLNAVSHAVVDLVAHVHYAASTVFSVMSGMSMTTTQSSAMANILTLLTFLGVHSTLLGLHERITLGFNVLRILEERVLSAIMQGEIWHVAKVGGETWHIAKADDERKE